VSEIEIPDYSRAYWGFGSDAVKAGARAFRAAPLPSHLPPDESRALVCIDSAYPALRRSVLESVVEDVARELCLFDWDETTQSVRDRYLARARRLLGVAGEETG
jgi:hypothetical protein